MLRAFVLLVCCFAAGLLSAQPRPKAPNVAGEAATPSATASAYNRENQIPVNHYTGLPQIGLPLHSYEGNGLKHSVSLSYFAGGAKVSEPAPNTGLGWNLSAGGAVTRTVQGLPDDMPGWGWLSMHNTRPSTTSPYQHCYYDFSMGMMVCQTYYNTINHLPQYYEDQADGQMDIFQVNAPGLSAKFYLGKNGSILTVPKQKIKIIPAFNSNLGITASTIESFTVIDQQGVRYVFNEREITTLTTSSGNNNSGLYNKSHITAWYISSIIAPFNEDTISFTYQNTSTSRDIQFPPSHMQSLWNVFQSSANNPSGTISVSGKRLTGVHFPDKTRVDLVYDSQLRCDVQNENALREIQVRDTALRSGYKLDYTYASQRGTVAYSSACNDIHKDYRLLLRAVTPYVRSSNMPPYQFEYDESRKLPPVTSAAQDHWGLFNNQIGNASLVPALNNLTGANRNPDTMAAKAYSLRNIRYPSGGVTSLEMEANDFFTVRPDEKTVNVNSGGYVTGSQPFSKLSTDATRFYFQLLNTGGDQLLWGQNDFCEIDVTIEGLYQGNWISGTTVPGGNVVRISSYDAASVPVRDLNFPPGTSEIRVTSVPVNGNLCTGNGYFEIAVKWFSELVETDPSAYRTGGLRVKRILEFDGLSPVPATVREFRYRMANGSGSSGFIKSRPRYDYNMRFTVGTSHDNFLVRNGMPVNFQHYTQGSPVGYSRVEEIYGTPERNLGRTEYEFTTYSDFQLPLHVLEHPYVPEQVQEWLLGLPKSVKNYDAAGRVKSESYNTWQNYPHQYAPADSAYLAVKLGVAHEVQGSNGSVLSRTFLEKYYRPVSGWVAETSSRDVSYMENDTLQQVSQTEYNTDFMVPVKTTETVNKKAGIINETFTYYPFHYTANTGALPHLRTQEWLYPVATETWQKEGASATLLDASVTDYQWVNGTQIRPVTQARLVSKDPVPQATIGAFNPAVLNRNTTLMPEVSQVTQFNSKGQPVETLNTITGQYQSVILDYDNDIPVTKVDNARQNEIAYTSFESQGRGNWQYTGTTNLETPRSLMGKRSYNLASANITKTGTPSGRNYIVSLWSKSGTVSVSPGSATRTEANTVTGWTYREYSVPGGGAITISGNAVIDELRMHPDNCVMATVNAEPTAGMISQCGADNMVAYQEYDTLNRPLIRRDKDWNIIQAAQYNFAAATTINRTPQWEDVAPTVLDCAKIPGTSYNNGNQVRMQVDRNPYSFSYGGAQWVPAGSNPAACPIVPDWQPTGNTRCPMVNGVRTGVQEREERDHHPLSPTYNQLRWVSLGVNGNCPPIQLRASIQFRNMQFWNNGYSYTTSGDVYIIITDQDWNPVTVPSLSVNYNEDQYYYGFPFSNNYTANITNSSEALIYSGQLSDYYYDYFLGNYVTNFSVSFTVLPGSGYTPW